MNVNIFVKSIQKILSILICLDYIAGFLLPQFSFRDLSVYWMSSGFKPNQLDIITTVAHFTE